MKRIEWLMGLNSVYLPLLEHKLCKNELQLMNWTAFIGAYSQKWDLNDY